MNKMSVHGVNKVPLSHQEAPKHVQQGIELLIAVEVGMYRDREAVWE